MKLRIFFMSFLVVPLCLFASQHRNPRLQPVHKPVKIKKEDIQKVQKEDAPLAQSEEFPLVYSEDTPLFQNEDVFPVDPLQFTSIVVRDIEVAIAQLSAEAGTEFQPLQQQTWNVLLPNGDMEQVTLKSAFSQSGASFVELVEADPLVGPWALQEGVNSALGFQVFALDNIEDVAATFMKAGVNWMGFCDSNFLIYEYNGVLIKLINSSLLPSAGTNVSQEPIDEGNIVNLDTHVQNLTNAESVSAYIEEECSDF